MREASATDDFTHWLREAAPYLQAHRGRVGVVCLPGAAVADAGLADLLHDIAIIAYLGMRVVLVFGIRPQVEDCLGRQASQYVGDLRVTDDKAMACVERQAGAARLHIESRLTRALAGLSVRGAHTVTASGNFITARPYGVRDGVDFKHTGVVRHVDAEAIRRCLEAGAIALIQPLGFSPSGEVFNLVAEGVAEACAIALGADKLIIYHHRPLEDERRQPIRQLTPAEARKLLAAERGLDADAGRVLQTALRAAQAGVRRVHILDRHRPGAILQELFTRDGVGALLSAQPYDNIRTARSEDIPGVLAIIEGLERDGVLVKRGRDALEMEIARFMVATRDEAVIGCAAVYPYEQTDMAELACLAMAADYRGRGGGERLLGAAEARARQQGLRRLFVLTTQTADWFKERGFAAARIEALPIVKRRLYNYQRNAQAFIKPL